MAVWLVRGCGTEQEEKGVFWHLHIHRSQDWYTKMGRATNNKAAWWRACTSRSAGVVTSRGCVPYQPTCPFGHASWYGIRPLLVTMPLSASRCACPPRGQCGMGGSRTSNRNAQSGLSMLVKWAVVGIGKESKRRRPEAFVLEICSYSCMHELRTTSFTNSGDCPPHRRGRYRPHSQLGSVPLSAEKNKKRKMQNFTSTQNC